MPASFCLYFELRSGETFVAVFLDGVKDLAHLSGVGFLESFPFF
jgi:hypothetical protein